MIMSGWGGVRLFYVGLCRVSYLQAMFRYNVQEQQIDCRDIMQKAIIALLPYCDCLLFRMTCSNCRKDIVCSSLRTAGWHVQHNIVPTHSSPPIQTRWLA